MRYSWKKGLTKGFVGIIIFTIPVMIDQFSDIANLTLGGLGIMLVNFVKIKYWK